MYDNRLIDLYNEYKDKYDYYSYKVNVIISEYDRS